MQRLPAWLVFLLFVPLQIWLFFQIKDFWGLWPTVGFVFVIGIVATRATRAMGLRAMLFPGWAHRWEQRRHLFQGLLFLGALLSFAFTWGPQPWVGAFVGVSAIKAAVR